MNAILKRLDTFNCYCEDSDAKQLRKDAAEEIRRLEADLAAEQHKSRELEMLIQRRASQKMHRRVPA